MRVLTSGPASSMRAYRVQHATRTLWTARIPHSVRHTAPILDPAPGLACTTANGPVRSARLGFASSLRCIQTRAATTGFATAQAQAASPSLAQSSAAGQDLVNWLLQQGGEVTDVALQHTLSSDGRLVERQLCATKDLSPGQRVVWVPRHAMLRPDRVQDERLLRLFDRVPSGSASGGRAWQFKQALVICWHLSRGPASPFHSYLMALPGILPGVPPPMVGMLLGTTSLLRDELQYPPLNQDVYNQHYWWYKFSAEVLDPLPGTGDDPFNGMHIDRNTFGWAIAMASSRSFGLKRADTQVMVPLVDMIDHTTVPNCEMSTSAARNSGRAAAAAPAGASNATATATGGAAAATAATAPGPNASSGGGAAGGGDKDSEDVGLFVTQRVRAGEALRLCYGLYDNSSLLLGYGFIVPDNRHDRYWMQYDLELLAGVIAAFTKYDPRPLPDWKCRLLQRLDSTTGGDTSPGSDMAGAPSASDVERNAAAAAAAGGADKSEVWLGGSEVVDPRLLAALRIMLLQDDAQELVSPMSRERLGDWRAPIGRQHEIVVLQALAGHCTALYGGFQTTIQQDRAILSLLTKQVSAAASLKAAAPPETEPSAQGGAAAAAASSTDVSSSANGGEQMAPRKPIISPMEANEAGAQILAVHFRLELKLGLEKALIMVLARKKELEDLALPQA